VRMVGSMKSETFMQLVSLRSQLMRGVVIRTAKLIIRDGYVSRSIEAAKEIQHVGSRIAQ
jgi:hypothetical protein